MGAGHALEDRGADFVHERDVYFHGETNWVTWGAVRASSQRVFGTPLERRRRADLALLTHERLQTKIVNIIGTGKPKEIGSAHCMLCLLEALYVC